VAVNVFYILHYKDVTTGIRSSKTYTFPRAVLMMPNQKFSLLAIWIGEDVTNRIWHDGYYSFVSLVSGGIFGVLCWKKCWRHFQTVL